MVCEEKGQIERERPRSLQLEIIILIDILATFVKKKL